MRTPIAYALGFPDRIEAGVQPLNLIEIATLQFERPDTQRFPCLQLAYDALQLGGTASTVLNAANEVAVSSFLKKEMHFLDIPRLIGDALSHIAAEPVESLEQLIEIDLKARAYAQSWLTNASERVLSA